MRVTWYGQSAFALSGRSDVFIDPFADMSEATARGWSWKYPVIAGVSADVLLITHEHRDHNGLDEIAGVRQVVRSSAGTFDTPIGRVVGIASEHDDVAGTKRGANVIYVFELDGVRICHLGDFGQGQLRPEQRAAIGRVDLLFVPVGGGVTIDGHQAARLVDELSPSLVVPMHYRTPAVSIFDTVESFLAEVEGEIVTLDRPSFDADAMRADGGRIVVVPAVPIN